MIRQGSKFSLVAIILLIVSMAFAGVYDNGVTNTTDEFTGARTCMQVVVNAASDFTGLSLINDGTQNVGFVRSIPRITESVYNLYGVMSRDKVFVKFSDGSVETFTPNETGFGDDYTFEAAYVYSNRSLVNKILSSPGDLRIRFSGDDGTGDFTIDHEVILALAAGYGKSCM